MKINSHKPIESIPIQVYEKLMQASLELQEENDALKNKLNNLLRKHENEWKNASYTLDKSNRLLAEALEYIYYGNDEMSEELNQYYEQWYAEHKKQENKHD